MNKISIAVAGVLMLLLSRLVLAGVMVESSRVVFSAADPERTLILFNSNAYPVIVQSWVDDGSPDGTPENAINSPVMPLPGIFRLEPGERKSLRLLATQMPLPTDREVLYWLNIYEIPPADARLPKEAMLVKVAVRLQLKLFCRPAHLELSVDDVAEKQQFSIFRQPGLLALKVTNPTPYYATFDSVEVTDGSESQQVNVGMLAPFASKTLRLNGNQMDFPKKIHFLLINDDGNRVERNDTLR
ncbi:molecular chaperone [Citrobacter arsenatis]|uniref:Molecular chaperone n=1 Tax=Citrobacter arsenatis TaxID=2546350 RepID=A0A4P6WLK2_9ENTR|nr:molecular chaperone [Citrobacter arsenatis]QBM22876.1 molecular chaperone [Citrobacter arsenatis]